MKSGMSCVQQLLALSCLLGCSSAFAPIGVKVPLRTVSFVRPSTVVVFSTPDDTPPASEDELLVPLMRDVQVPDPVTGELPKPDKQDFETETTYPIPVPSPILLGLSMILGIVSTGTWPTLG